MVAASSLVPASAAPSQALGNDVLHLALLVAAVVIIHLPVGQHQGSVHVFAVVVVVVVVGVVVVVVVVVVVGQPPSSSSR
jgi:Mn2+/Fe2+ NRAMP family transporter